jgi:nicotinate-nucleotide adenylyltransferase
MRIGIFGGSFNPIHIGHLIIAERVIEMAELDNVIFVPVGLPCHKENKLLDSELRQELILKCIENKKYFEVSDIELRAGKTNYTYDTLLKFREENKEDTFVEIIGEDSAEYLHTWKNYKKLVEETEIFVFRRNGSNYKSPHKNIKVLDTPIIEISSTEIRNRLKKGESIAYMVPEKIEKILKELPW